MKKITMMMITLVLFWGCNSKDKELQKLQIQNEKMKGEILKTQIETLSKISNKKQQVIFSQWDQLKNVYQRRNDVVRKLVEFLDSYKDTLTEKEKQFLTAVTESLSQVEQVSLVEGINPIIKNKAFVEFQKEQDGLSANLGNLCNVIDEHANLKAMQEYLDMRVQLEATENRITVERMRLNERLNDI